MFIVGEVPGRRAGDLSKVVVSGVLGGSASFWATRPRLGESLIVVFSGDCEATRIG